MKKILRNLTVLLFGLLANTWVQAQESTNTSGANATGNGGSVAYTIGQVVYTTNSGGSGSMAQGVNQAYEIYALAIDETFFNISLIAFPNPTTEHLMLKISNYNNEKFLYQLFDLQGKLLNSEQVSSQETQIPMASLPAATYFIKVLNQENNQFQSFKIIKN